MEQSVLILLTLFLVCGASDFFSAFGGGGGMPFGARSQADSEYYDRLGLKRDASVSAIKKAYRQKAMQSHPDKGGDAEEFKRITEAYEVLSDEEKKARYDRFGMKAFEGPDVGRGGGSSAADAAREFFRGMGGFGDSFGANPFAQAFSVPIVLQVDLTLKDMFIGKEMNIELDLGERKSKVVKLDIRPGMMGGQELLVRNPDMDRDLIFRLREYKHAVFRRKNADLLMDLELSLREALLGFERPITHVDGKVVWVRSRKGDVINFNDVLVLPHQGMPVYGQPDVRGRLFVRCTIRLPKAGALSEDEMRVLEGLLPKDGSQVRDRVRARQAEDGEPTAVLKRSSLSQFGRMGVPDDEYYF